MTWKRLLKIKSYIDIFVTTLLIANDVDSRRDDQQLFKIMLTKNEWKLLGSLCIILKKFAEAITYLGVNKYMIYSIMNPLLKEIKKCIKLENTRS